MYFIFYFTKNGRKSKHYMAEIIHKGRKKYANEITKTNHKNKIKIVRTDSTDNVSTVTF